MNPIVGLPEPLLLGLHALGELGEKPGRCLTTAEIATQIGTTEPHLSKVLQRLAKGGFIKALRGPGGGYVLCCDLDKTQIAPIFELLGRNFRPSGCELGCNKQPCFITSMLDELSRAMYDYLGATSIRQFIYFYQNSGEVSIDITVTPKTEYKSKLKANN